MDSELCRPAGIRLAALIAKPNHGEEPFVSGDDRYRSPMVGGAGDDDGLYARHER